MHVPWIPIPVIQLQSYPVGFSVSHPETSPAPSSSSESNRSTAPLGFFAGTTGGAFFTGGAPPPVAATTAGLGGMAGFLGTLPDAIGGVAIDVLLTAAELRIGSEGFVDPGRDDSSPVLLPTETEADEGVGDVEARYDGFLATGGADGLAS